MIAIACGSMDNRDLSVSMHILTCYITNQFAYQINKSCMLFVRIKVNIVNLYNRSLR